MNKLPAPGGFTRGWHSIINVLSEDAWRFPAVLRAVMENAHVEVVSNLLDDGEFIDQNYRGVTPLMAASISGNAQLVDVLLKRGATLDLRFHQSGGRTALMAACVGSHPAIVKTLLTAGAKTDLCSFEGKRAIDELAEATEHRVLPPHQFVRFMACTRILMEHFAAEEMQKKVAQPENRISQQDQDLLEEWQGRVREEKETLSQMVLENVRRGTDHEAKFAWAVRDAAARTHHDVAGKWARRKLRARIRPVNESHDIRHEAS